MRFSQKTGCFYPEDIFYATLPDDLIVVSQEEFDAAMEISSILVYGEV
ncbi:hypothetical protein QZN00_30510 [Burkholderia multivorans]|nr:hypothetical protein [Burkholderia multivorans]